MASTNITIVLSQGGPLYLCMLFPEATWLQVHCITVVLYTLSITPGGGGGRTWMGAEL